MTAKKIKQYLLLFCQQQIMQKHTLVQDKIKSIAQALDGATKSSAGDKHQTTRAMLQIDREQAGERLAEIEKTFEVLQKSSLFIISCKAHLGRCVILFLCRFVFFF